MQLWKWFFKPLIILIVIYYSIRFLISAFSENGTERLFTILILSVTIFFILANLAGDLLSKVRIKILSKLSKKVKFKVLIIGKIIDYLAVLALGAVFYAFWEKDAVLVSILIILLLVERINNIIKEDKINCKN